MPKLFTGEHSTVMINFDNVTFATCESPGPSGNVVVHFISGDRLTLEHGNANMFRTAWCEYSNKDNRYKE